MQKKNLSVKDIIQYKKDHPNVSTSVMGKAFGCTRQNIYAVITKARLKDSDIPLFVNGGNAKDYISICKYCRKEVRVKGNKRVSHRTCFYEHTGVVQLKCPVCSTKFPITKSQYRYRLNHGQKYFYDKRECFYGTLGKT